MKNISLLVVLACLGCSNGDSSKSPPSNYKITANPKDPNQVTYTPTK